METALRSTGVQARVHWKAFQLNPGASDTPSNKLEMYMSKFGFEAVSVIGRREHALAATAVEVDEDAEPDEWIPTVQSYIVVAAGPRGGKRKR